MNTEQAMSEQDKAHIEELQTLRPSTVTHEIPGLGEVTQKPLTYFGKLEFFGILGRAIQMVIRSGVNLSEMLEDFTGSDDPRGALENSENLSQFATMDNLAKLISTFAMHAPDVMMELYLLALDGKDLGDRVTVTNAIREIDDETGIAIAQTFVDQNGKAIQDFFGQWTELVTKAVNRD